MMALITIKNELARAVYASQKQGYRINEGALFKPEGRTGPSHLPKLSIH